MKNGRPVPEVGFNTKETFGGFYPQNETCLSNTGVLNSTNESEGPADEEAIFEEDLRFTLKIYKGLKICIYKPLIPLKLTLFCWFGAGASIMSFLSVFVKQRGVTLAEFSTVYTISPFVQFLGPPISGAVADKLGSSKPVLVVNLLLTVAFAFGMLLVPRMNVLNSGNEKVNLDCYHQEFERLLATTERCRDSDIIELKYCNVLCVQNATQRCYGKNLICLLLSGNENFENFSLSVYVNGTFEEKNQCFYNVSSIVLNNTYYSWCTVPPKMNCSIECIWDLTPNSTDESRRTKFVVTIMAFLILFFTTYSNVYRILDVTSMSLVKEHNSDFGRQRFFSILGILFFSPVAGLVVEATTANGDEKNYASAFYLFIGFVILTLGTVYKLKVRLNPPGRKMWKKSIILMKNPEVAVFVCVIFVLGTAWGFTRSFTYWYLEDLSAPSFLLSLVPAISGLYGLPFLMKSNWWVEKIGTARIFLLGLVGYTISGVGYSFLINPWMSLIFEFTEVFTYHLLWVAVVTHSHSIAPKGLTATVIATAGAVHFSIGKASGSLIGGLIMETFGGRKTYRVIATICSTTAVFYGLYLYVGRVCYTKKSNIRERHGAAESMLAKCEGSVDISSLQNT